MNKLRFLVDECTRPAFPEGLRRVEPTIDVIRVGDPGAPPLGTKDPDLLLVAFVLGRALVTKDKTTMPGHLADHADAGHQTAGVMILRPQFSMGRQIREILDRWTRDTADDWIDRTEYIPLP